MTTRYKLIYPYSHLFLFCFRGESAFTSLVTGFGWSKNPMIKRIQYLDKRVPITFIYGQNTWMDKNIGETVKKIRQNCYVHVEVIIKSNKDYQHTKKEYIY